MASYLQSGYLTLSLSLFFLFFIFVDGTSNNNDIPRMRKQGTVRLPSGHRLFPPNNSPMRDDKLVSSFFFFFLFSPSFLFGSSLIRSHIRLSFQHVVFELRFHLWVPLLFPSL